MSVVLTATRPEVKPLMQIEFWNYRGHPGVNNSSVVLWKTTLKAGETLQSTVDYHFHTRH